MNDLAYVKEVIQALPFDHKKELFDHFIKNFSTKNQATKTPTEDIHPSTPEPTTSSKESQKRLLNSPLTPKRNKKDKKKKGKEKAHEIIILSSDDDEKSVIVLSSDDEFASHNSNLASTSRSKIKSESFDMKPVSPVSPTNNENSPSPTPSELPQYFCNKVLKLQAGSSFKLSPLQRTRPSETSVKCERINYEPGTVKLEYSTVKHNRRIQPNIIQEPTSSDYESDDKPIEQNQHLEEPLQIAHLKPRFFEFTHIFPPFPKTHKNGYAYIIELSDEVLNEKALVNLRDALQYSLTGGGGARVLENVEFFAVNGEKVPMKIHYRVCAGVKSCEFLAEKHKIPHTEVDEVEGYDWAKELYHQEMQQATSDAFTKVMEFYEAHKDQRCDRYTIATGHSCGGITRICAFNEGPLNARLFLGCSRWKGRESGHICIPLTNYDIVSTLRVWGKDRVDVHEDILEALHFQWEVEGETPELYHGNSAECHYVIANLQGNKKTQQCPYYHDVDGISRPVRGKIVQHDCDVKLYFLVPIFNNNSKPSTNKMVLICIGEHSHPPPPARKIPAKVKDTFIKVFRQFGLFEVTARRLLASPLLPILLDGKTNLSTHHIALTNMDAINHLIRKERLREHPLGTDILGVQYLMATQQLIDPYIRQAIQFDDGHFIILCQFQQQSHFLYTLKEIFADKTFRRNRCQEFEVNSYNPATKRLLTISRVWTDYEDAAGYYQAFRMIFGTAEQDVGRQISWGHLTDLKSRDGSCIQAVLVDEHSGQVKGLGQYFNEKFPMYTADEHIYKIVKVCQTHYLRSVTKLKKRGASQEICEILSRLPSHLTLESLDAALSIVRAETLKDKPLEALVNWLQHKDSNPWVLKCLCFPLTSMNAIDWIETSFTTNIAESAHALSQKYGKQMSLMGAIQAGQKLDSQYFELEKNVQLSGVMVNYGNNSATGRARKSLNRKKARMEVTKKSKQQQMTEKTLREAKNLVDAGISTEVVEQFLSSKSKAS